MTQSSDLRKSVRRAPEPTINRFGQLVGPRVAGWTPRLAPGVQVLFGTSVVVRPLARDDVPHLFAAICAPESAHRWTYMSTGPIGSVDGLKDYLEPMWDSSATNPMGFRTLEGEVVGMAAYHDIAPAQGSVEVGAVMFSPRFGRTRATTEAMTLMARHVFEDLGYRRYEWKCDALNTASRAAAQRLGFTSEGTTRNALIYKGRNRDTAWFGMTDDDWRILSPVHDRWLADTPDKGPQHSSLSSMTAAALRRADRHDA